MNPEDRKVMEMARDALLLIESSVHFDDCREFEEVQSVMAGTLEAIEERLQADEPEFGPVNLNDVEPDRLQADEKEEPVAAEILYVYQWDNPFRRSLDHRPWNGIHPDKCIEYVPLFAHGRKGNG